MVNSSSSYSEAKTDGDLTILILGASGMLGNSLFRYLSKNNRFNVYGSVRSPKNIAEIPQNLQNKIIKNLNVEKFDDVLKIFSTIRPNIVINCIGLVKQLAASNDILSAIPINSILPHRLSNACDIIGARFIHFSTDCVFSGAKGMYKESDFADADDVYGRTKFLGEVHGDTSITLRTSIIGHELMGSRSLISWFLAQSEAVQGYKHAIFSGLPTVEVARVIQDLVIPNLDLAGVFHLSSEPISKYALLELVAKQYKKNIKIIPNDYVALDRSLDSTKFRIATGFTPKPWGQLVELMHDFK